MPEQAWEALEVGRLRKAIQDDAYREDLLRAKGIVGPPLLTWQCPVLLLCLCPCVSPPCLLCEKNQGERIGGQGVPARALMSSVQQGDEAGGSHGIAQQLSFLTGYYRRGEWQDTFSAQSSTRVLGLKRMR